MILATMYFTTPTMRKYRFSPALLAKPKCCRWLLTDPKYRAEYKVCVCCKYGMFKQKFIKYPGFRNVEPKRSAISHFYSLELVGSLTEAFLEVCCLQSLHTFGLLKSCFSLPLPCSMGFQTVAGGAVPHLLLLLFILCPPGVRLLLRVSPCP